MPYYILIRKDTNRTWAISRKPFDFIPDHSRQEKTNESPLVIQRPDSDKAADWTDKAQQTVRASYSTRMHIMRAQQ